MMFPNSADTWGITVVSHASQQQFLGAVAAALPSKFTSSSVLEIGSLNINGSARDFVTEPSRYIGIDVGMGPGVDVVASGASFRSEERFALILSCECLEHNPEWRETLTNAVDLLDDAGVLVLSFASPGRPEHGTARAAPEASPLTLELGWDYYRNLTTRDVGKVLQHHGLTVWSATNWRAFDAYVIAGKNRAVLDGARRAGLDEFKHSLATVNRHPLPLFDRVVLSAARVRDLKRLPSWVRYLRNVVKVLEARRRSRSTSNPTSADRPAVQS